MRLIIDGDYPMAHGAFYLDRDLTAPIEEVRLGKNSKRRGFSSGWDDSETLASIPELRKGKIAAALVKVSVCIYRPELHSHGECRNRDIAYSIAQGELEYYRILEATGWSKILTTSRDINSHIKLWDEEEDSSELPFGMILGMEGADAIHWPKQVYDWWDKGLRVISLSHYGVSSYSHGTATGTEGGLVGDALELLKEMDNLGMILDVSHTSDKAVWEELDNFEGPILSSHHNCRSLAPGERQIPDGLLREIISRGAVIGSSMDTWMLHPKGVDWNNIPNRREVFPREEITLEHFVDHLDYVCQIAGNSLHAAIGGDTDGQGGRDGAPYEIDTVADYQKVGDILEKRGYKEADIENILYLNWKRFFEKNLPKS
jgi:membrane dipeptidase|tara:strand:- start:1415 stop:2533 length:1119 start_codon:yes stop_codon:yes gene_type:complete